MLDPFIVTYGMPSPLVLTTSAGGQGMAGPPGGFLSGASILETSYYLTLADINKIFLIDTEKTIYLPSRSIVPKGITFAFYVVQNAYLTLNVSSISTDLFYPSGLGTFINISPGSLVLCISFNDETWHLLELSLFSGASPSPDSFLIEALSNLTLSQLYHNKTIFSLSGSFTHSLAESLSIGTSLTCLRLGSSIDKLIINSLNPLDRFYSIYNSSPATTLSEYGDLPVCKISLKLLKQNYWYAEILGRVNFI